MNGYDQYFVGLHFGKLLSLLEYAIDRNKAKSEEIVKLKYTYIIDILNTISEHISEKTQFKIISQDLEKLISTLTEKYGEIKEKEELPQGKRLLGGLRQKISLGRQNRRSIKKDELEWLNGKITLLDDRLRHKFGNFLED